MDVLYAWASMGPRFFKRGEFDLQSTDAERYAASMGPRFFKRGEFSQRPAAARATLLQWGHAFSSVESRSRRFEQQLNHNASMGPRFFKRGEQDMTRVLTMVSAALQWGHAFSSVESIR
mgnify:CR=1 FL=1